MADRKPTSKKPADIILNQFLEKNGILLAMKDLPISRSTDGSITIRPAQPTAIYKEDIPKNPQASSDKPVVGNGVKEK